MIFGAEQLAGLYRQLGVREHPMLKLPTADQVASLLERDAGREELIDHLEKRQRRIRLSEDDPLGWGFEPGIWGDADRTLAGAGCNILAIFGGNRATKTVYAVKRGIQCATTYPGTRLAICSESEIASISTVQALAWQFLKPRFGHLNGKRDVVTKINYGQSGGFTERKVVLPNTSEIYFLTYNQEASDFEGWEFGAPAFIYADLAAQLKEQGHFVPPNIGAVTDESLPLRWLQMFSRRVKFRRAHVLWPFTPVKGITPAVKELVGSSAVTTEHRPSALLPRRNVKDCPEGTMPYIRRCVFPNAMAIYFFTEFNPFGPSPGRTYYDEVRELLEGKASDYIERVAYGFARDSVARAFPRFGSWNVVRREQLPAVGTNYFFCDPAGARNWFMIWVRVCPAIGGQNEFYIYRDWPDMRSWGEWAVPTEREVNEETRRGWDGDPGPAQVGHGFGIAAYKQVILDAELITEDNKDPQAVRRWQQAKARGEALDQVREDIADRYIDPRAGSNEHIAEDEGTCIINDFLKVQTDAKGVVIGPQMDLRPASGVSQEEGFTCVNELLDWNQEQDFMPVLNQPHLFVCEDCQQVRWMFENYTGRGGDKGAAKDPADLVRYMALAELEYLGNRPPPVPGRGF
jgi:hypothetical protein